MLGAVRNSQYGRQRRGRLFRSFQEVPKVMPICLLPTPRLVTNTECEAIQVGLGTSRTKPQISQTFTNIVPCGTTYNLRAGGGEGIGARIEGITAETSTCEAGDGITTHMSRNWPERKNLSVAECTEIELRYHMHAYPAKSPARFRSSPGILRDITNASILSLAPVSLH